MEEDNKQQKEEEISVLMQPLGFFIRSLVKDNI